MSEAYSNVTIRLSTTQKEQFEQLTQKLGLTMNAAFNVFVNASLRHNGLPFEVTLDPLDNPRTRERINHKLDETDHRLARGEAKRYTTAQAMDRLGIIADDV